MEEKLSGKLIGVALSFTTILASLYLLGFWSAFDIAILEFADFTDAVKLALYPALGSFLLLFMALGIAQMFDRDPPPVKLDAETAAKLRRQAARRHRVLLLSCALLLLVAVTMIPEPINWLFVAIFAAVLGMPVAEKVLPKTWVPDRKIRPLVIIVLLFAPGMAFSFGRTHAYWIKAGNADAIVDIARSELPVTGDVNNPVAYLGHIGSFFALYETRTRAVVLIAANDKSKLFLQHNPRHVMRVLGSTSPAPHPPVA